MNNPQNAALVANSERDEITIYAVGGAGINLGLKLQNAMRGRTASIFGRVRVVFADTSRSNVTAAVPESDCYIMKGCDGAGKKRDEHAQLIIERTPEILLKFKPTKHNIVIGSAGGGSGSVLGPSIVSQLLAKGEAVTAITIGSTATLKDAENTLNTLKSYEGAVRMRERPVGLTYLENSHELSRAKIDERVIQFVTCMAVLFSGNNAELDSQDLHNWRDFHRVTSFGPRLAFLDIVGGEREVNMSDDRVLISVATLSAQDRDSAIHGATPEYQAVGYVSPDAKEAHEPLPIHFMLFDGVFRPIVDRLSELVTRLKDEAEARRASSSSVLSSHDRVESNGLVL